MAGGGGIHSHAGDTIGQDDNGANAALPNSLVVGVAANAAGLAGLVYVASGVPASGVVGHLFAINTADSGSMYYNSGALTAPIWVRTTH